MVKSENRPGYAIPSIGVRSCRSADNNILQRTDEMPSSPKDALEQRRIRWSIFGHKSLLAG
jgi:hypothetical protein